MEYTRNEEKIRSELKGFWTAVEDDLINPQGEPFADNEKVRRLAERSAQAHSLMCTAYQQLIDTIGYPSRRSTSSMDVNRVLKGFGLKYSLNLLDNRLLLEQAFKANKS